MKDISQFPISSYLEQVCSELKESKSHFLVLSAETGAGKSTILPLGLLQNFEGKILITQPRRLAVVGVANRVADLLEEPCGETVGYKIHLENQTSNKTRMEIVTEAILLRYLQEDPSLEGYSVVVLDEFHERSIYTDMNLAFLKEAMELREDLYVIVMSATMDSQKLLEYLNPKKMQLEKMNEKSALETPYFKVPGRLFPVEIEYKQEMSVEDAIQAVVKEQFFNKSDFYKGKGILVFLPGIAEIKKSFQKLLDIFRAEVDDGRIEISILHSSISFAEQKYVLSGGKREALRIILSSAIAETSLTVPGIVCVIDSGLARINRLNVATGMENLVTEIESDFSAEQRSGRAGREGPGKCIRLWPKWEPRVQNIPPEILRTDLSQVVLECSQRGIFAVNGIDLIDKPSEGAWKSACNFLRTLDLLQLDGRITKKGEIVLSLGLNPRLACIAIEAAILGDISAANPLLINYGNYGASSKEIQNKFCRDIGNRVGKISKSVLDNIKSQAGDLDLLILAGFPDRLAKRISELGAQKREYQFPSGRKAVLSENDSVKKMGNNLCQWIVAPEVLAGNSEGVIFSYEVLADKKVEAWLENHSERKIFCSFENGKIRKEENVCYGELILSSKKLPTEKDDLLKAWIYEIEKKGLKALPMDLKTEQFLQRVLFYLQQNQNEDGKKENEIFSLNGGLSPECLNPDLFDSKLDFLKKLLEVKIVTGVGEWLPSFFGNASSLTNEIVYKALYWFLNGTEIDKEVPETIILPNKQKCKVKYEVQASSEDKNKLVIRPTIEIIIQRIFGCSTVPPVLGMKVLLKLLSPASRPLQITDDLEGFWVGAWPEICKEMKGRYPKHCWDV
ncbi:MAG: DEAD/DEAH box helicase [Treponema sp.]|nr:DEAD/DEAH box helicase [Treponema sp.]